MRISLKVIAAVCTLIALGIALQAFLQSQRLRALHLHEVRNDTSILADASAHAAATLWESGGREAAVAYLRRADAGREVSVALERPGDAVPAADRAVSRAPVEVGGVRVGTVAVARRPASSDPYLAQARRTQITTAVLLLTATVLVVLVLISLVVGRPVARLVEHAQRIGEGDFTPETVRSRDELGQLARAMNAMASKLEAAQSRLLQQRRRHASALEELRHADRLSTVGKLASSIAHEMGTPLNVVLGRASMLVAETEGDARANAEVIAAQAKRLHDIIQQLMQYARKEKVEADSTPLPDVMAHACTLVAPLAEDRGVEIDLKIDIDSDAHLDAGQTLQVLTNVMVNGIQAMKGGGTLSVRAAEVLVEKPPEKRARPGEFVRLRIRDTGPGMPDEVREHIFEPFFTTKKAGKGTGLGLSVCHGIVREAGGWIDVESKLGEGTTFDVYVPKETN